jgi:hypothetical protein
VANCKDRFGMSHGRNLRLCNGLGAICISQTEEIFDIFFPGGLSKMSIERFLPEKPKFIREFTDSNGSYPDSNGTPAQPSGN